MPTDQLITAVITATITLTFTIVLPRGLDLITGAQGRRRDALRQAWDDLEEGEKGRRADARAYSILAEHAMLLRRIIITHGSPDLLPPWPGEPAPPRRTRHQPRPRSSSRPTAARSTTPKEDSWAIRSSASEPR